MFKYFAAKIYIKYALYNVAMQELIAPARKIVRKPGTCEGVPLLEGTRIRVSDIAILYDFKGLRPEEIVDEYPGLTIADIFSALTYYAEHREGIRKEIKEREEFFKKIKQEQNDRNSV